MCFSFVFRVFSLNLCQRNKFVVDDNSLFDFCLTSLLSSTFHFVNKIFSNKKCSPQFFSSFQFWSSCRKTIKHYFNEMSSGFNLPVRKVPGASSSFGDSNNSNNGKSPSDPSRFSILGEPLPESATHDLGPPLGISVAAVIAAAVTRANQSDDVDRQMNNTSSKVPFMLPIRKVNENGRDDQGVDMSASWAVMS